MTVARRRNMQRHSVVPWSCSMLALAALAFLGACGTAVESNETALGGSSQDLQKLAGPPRAPCNRSDTPCVDLYLAAHYDDDLLFMNPDVQRSIRAGNRVVVVYKNGGGPYDAPDREDEDRNWLNRERGILNAYAYMARGDDAAFAANSVALSSDGRRIPDVVQPIVNGCTPGPSCNPEALLIGGLALTGYDIDTSYGSKVTLLFLRFQDGGTQELWKDATATAPITECHKPAAPDAPHCAWGAGFGEQHVTRESLIGFYQAVMERYAVTSVSALDATELNVDAPSGPAGVQGFTDNDEHMFTARFALAAAARVQAKTSRPISLRLSRGYSVDLEPTNLSTGEPEQLDKQKAFLYYAMFDQGALYPSVGGGPFGPCDPDPSVPCAVDPNMPGRFEAKGATPENRLTGIIPFNYAGTYFSDPNSHVNPLFNGALAWQSRKYTTRTLVGTESLRGRLQQGNALCLGTSGLQPAFVDCASAPSWTLTTDNRIRIALESATYCLTASHDVVPPATGPESISLAPCTAVDGSQTMFAFANGQIRTPESRCLAGAAGQALQSVECEHAFLDVHPRSTGSAIVGTDQVFTYDFDAETTMTRIELVWGASFARDYEVQVDPVTLHKPLPGTPPRWTTCGGCTITHGDGGTDEILVQLPGEPDDIRTFHVRVLAHQYDASRPFALSDFYIRRAAGKPATAQDWTLLFGPIQLATTAWSNASGAASFDYYYKTLAIVNRNLCIRFTDGNYCSPSTGGLSVGPAVRGPTDYADGFGWNHSETGATVRSVWTGADPGGSTIACGRGIAGASCTNALHTTAFADAEGWNAPISAQSIRFVDLLQNGRISVCGRGAGGISCALNQGSTWAPVTTLTNQFASWAGWDVLATASTIQFGDLDGDGRLDVCGRHGLAGMRCAVLAADGTRFINPHDWSFDNDRTTASRFDFSDADPVVNWSTSAAYYGSIRLVDVNRDGMADVCGRAPDGVYCAFSTGTSFEPKRRVQLDLYDLAGWGQPSTGGTLTFGDLNGNKSIDLCVRGFNGVACAEGY
jgi:hypothetical protein